MAETIGVSEGSGWEGVEEGDKVEDTSRPRKGGDAVTSSILCFLDVLAIAKCAFLLLGGILVDLQTNNSFSNFLSKMGVGFI